MIVIAVQVGGVECSAADATACLRVLEPEAKRHTTFPAIKNRLGAYKNPLSEADFWQVVNDWRASHPGVGLTTKVVLKTTALGDLTPFYLSSAELEFAHQHLQSYALYRVYDVLASPPRFFALEGNDILQLELTPVTYRAYLPAQVPARDRTDG